MNRVILGLAVMFGGLVATASTGRAENESPLLPDPQTVRGRSYVVIPPPPPEEAAQHFSRILFLNRCASGCTVTFGSDNSSTNRSSIAQGTLSAFVYGTAKWQQVVDCTKEIFAPFDIDVTDVDPGATEHMEAMVAGRGSQVGAGGGTLGFAPFSCGYIPRSISFTFANDPYYSGGGGDVDEICATIGQEAAHTWGLDHEYLASDPMTYLPYSGRRHFAPQYVQCHNQSLQIYPCACAGNTGIMSSGQNSVVAITGVFGSATPTPPRITITNPADGAQVEPGFPVHATADEALIRAELRVDGQLAMSITSPPYAFNAQATLGDGTHRVEVRGYDIQNTPGSAFIDVTIGEPCQTPADCIPQGETFTCVGGRCVQGEGAPGGLGTPCTGDEQCYSGTCLSDGTDMYCVEACEPGGGDCPSGYGCLPFEGGGVCWPGAPGDGPGTCAASTDGNSALPIGFALAFAGLVLRRRRRR